MKAVLRFHFLFLSLLSSSFLKAQTAVPVLPPYQPEQDACGAIPVCGNFTTPYVYKGAGSTTTSIPFCITESSSVWLKLKAVSSGSMAFTITPLNATNNIDFSVFLMGNSCNNLTSLECNNYYAQGQTGLTTINPSGPFSNIINIFAGNEYFILVNNYFNYQFPEIYADGFSIDFSGSTATFSNDSLPRIKDVKPTCNKSQQITLMMSEPVQCASIAADGSDFYISSNPGSIIGAYGFNCTQTGSANGYTNEVTVQFETPLSPGNYSLHVQAGTDGNNLLDLCGSALLIPDSISFTVDPYSPPVFTSLDSPACQFLQVSFSHKVLCDSVAANGSDFLVSGPSQVNVVRASGTDCDINGFTKKVLVELEHPITTDGTYFLVAKKGTDHNTLVDSCTGFQLEGNEIPFKINSYNGELVAEPDTILCMADTIQLRSNIFACVNPTNCGIDTGGNSNGCYSLSKEITGVFGTSFFPGFGNSSVFTATQYYYANRRQMLFRASELQAFGLKAGTVKKIGWTVRPATNGLPFTSFSDFTIKIGCFGQNSLPAGLSIIPDLRTVYYSNVYSPVPFLNEFVLDSAYNWDGNTNLVVEVCGIPNLILGTVSAVTKTSLTDFNAGIYLFSSQQVDGCTLNDPTSIGDIPTQRPDTRFTICSPPLSEAGPYHWSPVSYITGDTSTPATTAYTQASGGFVVNTTDRFGCYLRDSVHVIVSKLKPRVIPSEDSICVGDKLQLMADAGVTPSFYTWLTTDPVSLSCVDCKDPVAKPVNSTFYKVVITDQYDCNDTLPVGIYVIPLPKIDALPKDTTIKYGSSIQLDASGADLYSWSPASSLSIPFIKNPVASPLEPTDYIVVGISNNGCRNMDTVHVAIDYEDNLFVPSAFSPNGNGSNDLFRISNLSFQKILEFSVFNRWGQLVFFSHDNTGWDGTYKGAKSDLGIYHYLIKIGLPNGVARTYKGDVTLVR